VRALLVVNPRSRRGRALGGAAASELKRLGVELVFGKSAPSHIDAIVVAGGDGSVTRQIPHAIALGVPIGVVPLGTFNDLARTLGVPLDVAGACAVIATGRTRTLDVARVNGAYYLSEASIGVSSRIARLQRPEDKQRFGAMAILATILQAPRFMRPFHAEIAYDGKRERLRSIQLTVANSQRFGGFITVADAAIDDGWLDLYSVEIENPAQLFAFVGSLITGKRQSTRGLRTLRSTAFSVVTKRRHHIRADGEPAGKTPARFEILRQALKVFAPPI
jgi:diacylglycerol kinase (ATP)